MSATSQWDMYVKVLPGCTDTNAANRDPFATELEESACVYTYGCHDAANPNYDPMAGRHNQSLCAIMPEPEPEPEPPPEPEPEPEPEPWACPVARRDALSDRLQALATAANCFEDLVSVSTSEDESPCSEECKAGTEADGVFHVCDAADNEEWDVCLEAANRRQSYALAGHVLQWRRGCFGRSFNPCDLDAEAAASYAAANAANAIGAQETTAALAMEGTGVLVSMSLEPWPDKAEGGMQVALAASADAESGWPPLRQALSKTLRVHYTTVLLHSDWVANANSTSLQLKFVLTDDPSSDRSSRHVYSELLKRVRMFMAAPPTPEVSAEENPLPLSTWQPTAVDAAYGAGRCISYDFAGDAVEVACTSGWSVALQWVALFYQVAVACVVAGAVSIHATQHMTKWMGSAQGVTQGQMVAGVSEISPRDMHGTPLKEGDARPKPTATHTV